MFFGTNDAQLKIWDADICLHCNSSRRIIIGPEIPAIEGDLKGCGMLHMHSTHSHALRALTEATKAAWFGGRIRSVPITRSVWNDAPAGTRETEEKFYDSTVEKVSTVMLVEESHTIRHCTNF